MKLILKNLFFVCFCTINITVFSQKNNKMSVNFVKEIIEQDTCIRLFSVKEFNKKSNRDWFALMEYIHNVVLILPNDKDWDEIDEKTKKDVYYTSSCENVIFYCIDNVIDLSMFTFDNLSKNQEFRQKIICKFYYNNGVLVVDTLGLYYKDYLRYKSSK